MVGNDAERVERASFRDEETSYLVLRRSIAQVVRAVSYVMGDWGLIKHDSLRERIRSVSRAYVILMSGMPTLNLSCKLL